jgi:hypothetical protein
LNYHLLVRAASEPGSLSTYVHTSVFVTEATGDGLVTTVIHSEQRELVWDIGQDISVMTSAKRAVEAFNKAAGLKEVI